jgi:hypothetical protein
MLMGLPDMVRVLVLMRSMLTAMNMLFRLCIDMRMSMLMKMLVGVIMGMFMRVK